MNCSSSPPERPGSGTWEWRDGSIEYGTEVQDIIFIYFIYIYIIKYIY